MRLVLPLVTLLLLGIAGFAQAPVPKGNVPVFHLASAVERDGKVIVEIFELREVARMKLEKGGDVFIEMRHWLVLRSGELGKDIRAIGLDGKAVDGKEVLKALAQPRSVACFMGYDKAKNQPDPLYLNALREGSFALAFELPKPGPGILP